MTMYRLFVPMLRLLSGMPSFLERGRASTGNHWTSRISHLVLGANVVFVGTPGMM